MALIQSQMSAGGVTAGVVIGRVSHAAIKRRSAAWTRDYAATPWSGGASPAPVTIEMAVSIMVIDALALTRSALIRGTL